MTERFVVSHGWQYAWCDPRHIGNYSIRECIKGPFAKPKFAYPVPTVTYCQTDSNGSLLTAPNCWVEHLSFDIGLDYFPPESYESMYRRYADVIGPSRKNCVIAGQDFGQGIPDPWTTSPYVGNLKTHRHFPLADLLDLKKNISQLLRSRSHQSSYKGSPCFCCQKKYLFECPDKSNACVLRDRKYLNCSCLDCHKKTTKPANDSHKKCLCLYRNQVLENEDSPEEKVSGEASRKNVESDYSLTNPKSSSEEVATENLVCTCGQNQIPSTNATFASTGTNEEKPEPKKDKNHREFPKSNVVNVWYTQTPRYNLEDGLQKKFSFYPCTKNSESRKNEISSRGHVKNLAEGTEKSKMNTIVSREVQTEISNAFISKNKKESSEQVENDKVQRFSSYSDHKRKEKSKTKTVPPNSCFAYYMTQNLGPVCPYSYSNYFSTHKCPGANGQIKKKTRRGKKEEEESEDGSSNFSPMKEKKSKNESMKSKYRNWMYNYEPSRSDNKARDSTENCFRFQPSVPPFDQLKLIAENKLRSYMDRKKLPTGMVNNKFFPHSNSSQVPSRYRDVFEGRAGWGDADMERCKLISRDRFRHSPVDEQKFLSYKINNRSTLSDSGFKIATASARGEFSRKASTKHLKEIVESHEPIAYGMSRNPENSTKGGKRRKRLARGRKRRRKLVGRRSLVLGKPPSDLKRDIKNIQADDTEVSEMDQNKLSPQSKKVNGLTEHNRKTSEMLNHCHNLKHSSPFGNSYLKPYSNAPVGTLTRIREEVFHNRYEPLGCRKRQSDVHEVLERIPYNSLNALPSCNLGTTVGDLQFKKRPGRAYRTKPF